MLVLLVAILVGPYDCHVSRVIDGDTFVTTCSVWPGLVAQGEHVRVRGIDAPERGGRAACAREAVLAGMATSAAREHLRRVKLTAVGRDNFGRLLAHVEFTLHGKPRDWGAYLQERGLAIPAGSGGSWPWCTP